MRELNLTKGYKALVDDEDYNRVNQYSWNAQVTFNTRTGLYTVRGKRSVTIDIGVRKTHYLSNEILGIKSWENRGFVVDHGDRNTLNEQKYNLSIVTYSKNAKNTKSHENRIGVSWDFRKCKWRAYKPRDNGNPKHIGLYDYFDEACEAARCV